MRYILPKKILKCSMGTKTYEELFPYLAADVVQRKWLDNGRLRSLRGVIEEFYPNVSIGQIDFDSECHCYSKETLVPAYIKIEVEVDDTKDLETLYKAEFSIERWTLDELPVKSCDECKGWIRVDLRVFETGHRVPG